MQFHLLVVLAAAALALAVPTRRAETPLLGASWQIILSKRIDATATLTPDVDVYEIDLFGNSKEDITALSAQGKQVVCYFSGGAGVAQMPDYPFLQPYEGAVINGWPDDRWLDIRQQAVRDVMATRIAMAASNGCTSVDADNMDAYVSFRKS